MAKTVRSAIKLSPGEAYVVMGAHQLRSISSMMRTLSTYDDYYDEEEQDRLVSAANHFDAYINKTEVAIPDATD